jgi:biopolymer transport protein ExbB
MINIVHFIHGGGFVMYPLLLLSISAIVVIVERLLAYHDLGHTAPGLLTDIKSLCGNGSYADALAAAKSVRGPVSSCIAVIIEHRDQPTREVERLVEETGQEFFMKLERFLPVLDTATTIAPLLGLLGTIVGMIGAFNAIATQQGHNNDSVLSGVGEALYATATGLIVAVICFAAYNYFSARLRTITGETEQSATRLINWLLEQHRQERHHEQENDPMAFLVEASESGIQKTKRA